MTETRDFNWEKFQITLESASTLGARCEMISSGALSYFRETLSLAPELTTEAGASDTAVEVWSLLSAVSELTSTETRALDLSEDVSQTFLQTLSEALFSLVSSGLGNPKLSEGWQLFGLSFCSYLRGLTSD